MSEPTSTSNIRPMLAAQKYRDAGDLWGPLHEKIVARHLEEDKFLIMQPKWDGMRSCFSKGVARSRSWKPLANLALQTFAKDQATFLEGLDSEVFSGHAYSPSTFRESMSGVRSSGGSGDLTVVVFDSIKDHVYHYSTRRVYLEAPNMWGLSTTEPKIFETSTYCVHLLLCPEIPVYSLEDIYKEEARLLSLGYEGGIIRRPFKSYKFGRATALGGELVKVKRRDTIDAEVIGVEPWYENRNEATTNDLGYTVRTAHQENKIPLDRLGALYLRLVEDPEVTFKCGVMRGVTHTDRDYLWAIRGSLIGRHCEISMDKADAGYDAPRCPVFIRWRDSSEF